jgi:hypothetical protein
MSVDQGGYVRRHSDTGFHPGTGGFGTVPPKFVAQIDAACRAFLERRGLRTENEILSQQRAIRMNADRRARR